MHFREPAEERCPCGSDRAYPGCCGAVLRGPSALGRDALVAWARERGVLDALETVAAYLPHRAKTVASLLPRWMRNTTVEEVLTAELPLSAHDEQGLLVARAATWAFLSGEAAAVREGQAAERRPRALPRDPTLAVVAEALLTLRAEVRKTASPRATEALRHCSVRVLPEARRFLFHEHRRVQRNSMGVVLPAVQLALARVLMEPLSAPACTCEARAPCSHVLAAIDLALEQLGDPRPPVTWEALARALETPDWSRVLSTLDAVHASRRSAEEHPATRFSFSAGALGGGRLDVTPILHKRLRTGAYSQGRRLRVGELLRGDLKVSREDRRALEPYGLRHGYGVGGYPMATYGVRLEQLLALVDHPRVFVADGDEPYAVRRAELGFAVRPGDGGGLELGPSLGGLPLSPEELATALRHPDGDPYFARIDPERRQILVARIVDPEATQALAHALVTHGHRFPPEAESALFERLGLLQELLPVEVPEGLEGEEVAPARGLVARLELREAGVELRLLARSLDGAPAQPPGEGPARLVSSAGPTRVFVRRDLEGERKAATALLAALPTAGAVSAGAFHLILSDDEAALALLEALRSFEDPALRVEWVGARPRVHRASRARELRVKVADGADWFGLTGEVELDGERIRLAVLLEALRAGRRVVRLQGGAWLAITAELAERLAPLAHLSSPRREGVEIGPGALAVLDDLERDGATLDTSGAFAQLHARMRDAGRKTPRVPQAFAGELRPYQTEGFRWLARLASWGAGAVLADDMGLGKTLQALALLCHRAKEGPALVVAPTSVCSNWVAEAARFAPRLNVTLFRESDRAGAVQALGPGDVLVVSYGLLVLDLERFLGKRFATLVLDEAQAVKNADTRRARAMRQLDAAFRLALSGTPVENHLGELWSVFRIAFPGLLGSWDAFRQRFAAPIERFGDPDRRRVLAATLRPFLLRRTKAEVAPELPSRTEIAIPVTLSPAEQRLYEQARLAAIAQLAQLAGERREGAAGQRFQVLAAITRLRLLACHPRLYEAESPLPSAKLRRFVELAAELAEGGHRALVFSQFTSHLALAQEALTEAGRTFLYLDGQTPAARRDDLVARFQAGEGELFLISLKAGGTGLNLTAADYVIHLDPWWNPAVEDQATDRAHRIGQRRPVTVYRLVAQGTIEEAIVSLHERKRELVAGVLDGMDAAGRLSPDELMALIRAGPDAASAPGALAAREDAALDVETEGEALNAPGERGGGGDAAEAQEPPRSEEGDSPPAPGRPAVAGAGSSRPHAPVGPRLSVEHQALLERFEHYLQRQCESGRLHSPTTIRAYAKAARRFFQHLTERRHPAASLAEDLPTLVPRYLADLLSGRVAAPASEPVIARAAARWLAAMLKAG